ncbi:MAG TPA: hypothetical protein VFI68_07035 [Anaerolineales bacterium]|nr:hypothetical protein [Anaerolineales bacterium]
MISPLSRTLIRILAVLYTVLGAILFAAPTWSAANFSWKISPFVAMTMGGWCLGNAFTAWETARIGRWSLAYANVVYLCLFGLLEAAVLVLFRGKLILNVPMAWPYLLALTLNVIVAVLLTIEWLRTKPEISAEGSEVPAWTRWMMGAFVLFVGFLAIYGWFSGAEDHGTDASVFPEALSLFTLRAFASFYAALAFAVVPLIWAKGSSAVLTLGRAGMSFIIIITIAALVNLDKFNFAEHPGQFAYLVAYIGAFIVLSGVWLYEKRRQRAATG